MRSSSALAVLSPPRAALTFLSFRFLHGSEIAEDEFRVDDFDVAHRVDRAGDVKDVTILETANDLDDGVDFADMGQELVAESLTRAGALDQSGDVDEFENGRNEFLRFGNAGQHGQSLVGHGDDAAVGLDGAERIVGRLRVAGAGDCVKKSALPDIGKPDDASA